MSSLLYREDMDPVRTRLTAWWNGEDLGRPMMQITAPREAPLERVEVMPEPPGWLTHYSTRDFAYRVNLSARTCVNTHYLAEAVPFECPDLAPNCLALYLGCVGEETEGTVWCQPCMARPEDARFVFDPANFYWNFTLRLGREQLRIGKNKFLIQIPDLIEGLDTLAAMRGTSELLHDLIERPDWVHSCLRQITDRYFHYYDILYDMFRDEVGGSIFWAWAPGRMVKLQCDFSAMIGPAMFEEFMGLVLAEMSERTSYSVYHLDGPGAISHLDTLLSLPKLDMIQWTPGAGVPPPENPRWWPLYHRILDNGKKVFILDLECRSSEPLKAMRREFGPGLNRFLIRKSVGSVREADELLRAISS
jgi:5-methyltetrahydrofolate--homocysteine methyltransferase